MNSPCAGSKPFCVRPSRLPLRVASWSSGLGFQNLAPKGPGGYGNRFAGCICPARHDDTGGWMEDHLMTIWWVGLDVWMIFDDDWDDSWRFRMMTHDDVELLSYPADSRGSYRLLIHASASEGLRFDGWRLQWKLDSWIIGVESWANDWTLIVGMIGILNGDFRCQWWKTLGDEPGSPKAHVRMRRHGQWMGTSHATNGDIYRYICAGWWGSPWINGGLLKKIPISIPWGWWSRSETSETQRGVVFWLWYGVITTDILWTMDNWKDYCNDHLLE